jgi:cyclase
MDSVLLQKQSSRREMLRNSASFAAGALLAHENTKKRMTETHDLPVLGLHSPPSQADALPQQTFASSHKLQGNGETLLLWHFFPAHTDTDIYIRFENANVIHMGDTFFNGFIRSSIPEPAGESAV